MVTLPFFSVIIPLYNKEDYIAETIASVLNQSFTDLELIVVNDCSTDNSVALVEQINDERINIAAHTTNQGLSATRNTGIKLAKGKVICLIDADDLWDTNFLSTIYSLHEKFPEADFYGTDYYEQYVFGNLRTNKTLDKTLEGQSFLVDDFFINNLGQPIVSQSSMGFKKDAIQNIDVFDTTIKFAEDVDLYVKAFSTYKLAYCFSPLAIYRCDIPKQMTGSKISDKQYPDFDSYETLAKTNASLKKYIDFQRYSFAVNLKLEGSNQQAQHLLKNLDRNNLNNKQKFLLDLPVPILRTVKRFKNYLLKKQIKISTY